jgi:hypothetical protein
MGGFINPYNFLDGYGMKKVLCKVKLNKDFCNNLGTMIFRYQYNINHIQFMIITENNHNIVNYLCCKPFLFCLTKGPRKTE